MIWRVRRVLTGHDAEGKSTIIADGQAPNVKEMASMPGLALTDLWETTGAPADNAGHSDAAARPVRLEPPKNGTLFRIVEFPPDSQWRNRADARAAFDSIGAGHAPDRSSADPMMHKTSTVDYIVVLKGEIHAVLDKGEYAFKSYKPKFYSVPIDGPVGNLIRATGNHHMRPAHMHAIVSAPGYQPVITHVFVEGDPYLDNDAVYAVKDSLVGKYHKVNDAGEAKRLGMPNPFLRLDWDFRLAPEAGVKARKKIAASDAIA